MSPTKKKKAPVVVMSVVGARPNFIKIAPIIRALKQATWAKHILVHTGQHYGDMSDSFFRDLGIPAPKHNLQVGSSSHARQTAQIMIGLEEIFLREAPDIILLVGDVNSTVAASLTAAKLSIPVAHIEAGLRSGDLSMPEEINRLVTDRLSQHLYTHEDSANRNLQREGVPARQVHFVGNIMIDSLRYNLDRAKRLPTIEKFELRPRHYALLTLHRPSNVDNPRTFRRILSAISTIQKSTIIAWPIHPRTQKMIDKLKLGPSLRRMKNLVRLPPLGYLDFLCLMTECQFVLTDSGGIQEETTALRIPCLTLRENTERPITVSQGSNTVVGSDPKKIIRSARQIIAGKPKRGRVPKYWDGRTAQRIATHLRKVLI